MTKLVFRRRWPSPTELAEMADALERQGYHLTMEIEPHMTDLTSERLKEFLDYDSETGIFRWKVGRTNVLAGTIAGNLESNGYRRVTIDGRRHLAHRLAWMFVHGEMPNCGLDHINRNKDDNRISNLRLANASQNQGNVSSWNTNTSGFRGVTFRSDRKGGRRWRAHLQIGGRNIYLGSFKTKEEAGEAYRARARIHFGEFFS